MQARVGPGETEALSIVTVPGALVHTAILTHAGYPSTAVLYRADSHGHFHGEKVTGNRMALPTRGSGRRIAYTYGFHARPYRGRGCALLTFTVPSHGSLGSAQMVVAVQPPHGRAALVNGQHGAPFSVVFDPHDKPGSLHPMSPAQLAVIARKACLGQI